MLAMFCVVVITLGPSLYRRKMRFVWLALCVPFCFTNIVFAGMLTVAIWATETHAFMFRVASWNCLLIIVASYNCCWPLLASVDKNYPASAPAFPLPLPPPLTPPSESPLPPPTDLSVYILDRAV